MAVFNIGLIGAGTVGGGVVKILKKQASFFQTQLGLPVHLHRIADKDTTRFASLPVGDTICSDNADDILNDPDIHAVIELVGGTGFARQVILTALVAKKHVITANKALIAEYGPEIFAAAEKNGVSVSFEASVGGGMPIIKAIREGLIGNDIISIKTIINGTCNYILSRMENENLSFADALSAAQKSGFAEADPTLDVGGGDSGHKVAIMASLISGGWVPYEDMPIEGITGISAEDIAFASELGYRIKLLGVLRSSEKGLEARVHPAMLKCDHILASVMNEFNAVLIKGDAVDDILLYGRGAGEMPTASAVVSDVIDTARNVLGNTPNRIPMGFYVTGNKKAIRPIAELTARYYLRFSVIEKPNVLAPIAAALGENGISIASVLQKEGSSKDRVPVIIITHSAQEKNLQTAIQKIEAMAFVRDKTQIIRIED